MEQFAVRFLVGGGIVSLFAALGSVLKPKSFAGLFGAAPSVALATLGLTIATNGKVYASIEARSMILGAVSFAFYAAICCFLTKKRFHAAPVALLMLVFWVLCALGLKEIVLH